MVHLQLLIQKTITPHILLCQEPSGFAATTALSWSRFLFYYELQYSRVSKIFFSSIFFRVFENHHYAFFFFLTTKKTHLRAKCKYFGSALTRLLTPLLSSNQASSWLGQFDLLWGFCSLKTHPLSPFRIHFRRDGLSQITETERHDPKVAHRPWCPSLPTPLPCWGRVCCTQAWAITQETASLIRCPPILPLSVHFSFLFGCVNFSHSTNNRSFKKKSTRSPSS